MSRPSVRDVVGDGAGGAGEAPRVRIPVAQLRARFGAAALLRVSLPIVLIGIASVTTGSFLSGANLTNVVRQVSVVAIVATGLTFVTMSGNFFALSTAATAAFAALCFAKFAIAGWPDLIALALALGAGAAIGGIQGLVVAARGNPIVVSLAASAALVGLVSIVSRGFAVPWTTKLTWLGAEYAATYAAIGLAVLSALLLRFTGPGRRLILSGANRAAAINAGINVGGSTVLAFALYGTSCAIAGLLEAAQFGQVVATNYSSLDLAAVTAVLIGGTAASGGRGSVWRCILGALFVGVLLNIGVLRGWGTGAQDVFIGLAMIVMVTALTAVGSGRSWRRPRLRRTEG